MSDTERSWLEESLGRRVGLAAPPWVLHEHDDWPTYGYDGPLADLDWDEEEAGRHFTSSGHTRVVGPVHILHREEVSE